MWYITLYFEFFKIGLFAIGGGLATLPFLYELSAKVNAFNGADIPSMLALSQLLPGAIGVNLASCMGSGVSPAASYIAVFAMITPQIITIILISRLWGRFNNNKLAKNIFSALHPAAAALLAAAAAGIWKLSLYNENPAAAKTLPDYVNILPLVIFIIIFICIRKFKPHPAVFILGAGALGVIFKL